MKKSKNKISDWLDKHGDPEIQKLVEQQAKQIMAKNNIEYQYLNLLQNILDNGVEKETRNGKTISVFGRQLRHKMSEGFPALTTKKFAFKTMTTELLWFLQGGTNIKYLVDRGCHIWDGDCYQAYCKIASSVEEPDYDIHVDDPMQNCTRLMTQKEFIEKIKTDDEFAKKWGELGPIYGKQWRSWKFTDKFTNGEQIAYVNGSIDQIKNLINELKTNPDSRRLMVSAWNVGELDQMVLPPCHYGFQVYTRELSIDERIDILNKRTNPLQSSDDYYKEHLDSEGIPTRAISLIFNMRSNDVPLGLPFNIASYGLLLEIIGKMVNMVPDELVASLGDVHIYKDQIDGVKEQLTREPYSLPKLKHLKTDDFYKTLSEDLSLISHLDNTDFELVNYQSHPRIKMPLSN